MKPRRVAPSRAEIFIFIRAKQIAGGLEYKYVRFPKAILIKLFLLCGQFLRVDYCVILLAIEITTEPQSDISIICDFHADILVACNF